MKTVELKYQSMRFRLFTPKGIIERPVEKVYFMFGRHFSPLPNQYPISGSALNIYHSFFSAN